MKVSAPLAQVLMAGRAQFNARAAEAKRRYRALDPAAFAAFLQTGVDGVVQAVAATGPERLAPVVLVAYDMALELVGQGLAGPGARTRFVDRVWQELIPQFAGLVAQQPVDVLAALSNAALNIDKIPNARTGQWLKEMGALAPQIDTLARLQAVGQILAWRAGLAHFRRGALEIANDLPEAISLAAVGATVEENAGAQWPLVRNKLIANPWWTPGAIGDPAAPGDIGQFIGQFTGFGGSFREPPVVRACNDGFVVRSAGRYSFLVADAHGAVLLPGSHEEFEQAANFTGSKAPKISGSQIVFKDRKVDLELPSGQFSLACNAHTVAVSSPYSYRIRLFPLQ